mmetsp:Transcript_22056/g.37836  ORF Transcript_22056/g.37836 Transcript_22056/m.37836 type:complete len:150 (+) Transcript_22056:46-495(+)
MRLSGIFAVLLGLARLDLGAAKLARTLQRSSCDLPSAFDEASTNSQFRGSLAAWDGNPISDASGEIGKNSGNCILLPNPAQGLPARYFCSLILELDAGGTVMLQGFEASSPGVEATLGITGGTGCYEGVTGSYQVSANDAFDVFSYTLN